MSAVASRIFENENRRLIIVRYTNFVAVLREQLYRTLRLFARPYSKNL